jgi:CRISPR-associated endonuclease Csn1
MATKRVLGLDLGTTSIGWALVDEAQNDSEVSKIIRTGVRIVPYGDNLKIKDNKTGKLSDIRNVEDDFGAGKGISPNAGRTAKRGARRSLQRYKQRREHLIAILKEHGILDEKPIAENGKGTTFSLLELRDKAARQEIELHDFARVLFAINKKRGYKSSRKAKDESEGTSIDGMETAKLLFHKNITPGQLMYERLSEGKKNTPEFYPSDLENEFDAIWEKQLSFYQEILTNELKESLQGKNGRQTWATCKEPFGIEGVSLKGKPNEQKLEKYRLRSVGLAEQLDLEHLAIVFQEIRNQISNTSGYLGAISDRSKELYFNKETVGQFLYKQVKANPHARLKNQVFYRKDYEDEFDTIWAVQSKNRKDVLTDALRQEIKDCIIFHQRRLKSQKGQIAICEFEGREIEIRDKDGKPILTRDGKTKRKVVGPRVIPKSSPLFQEFKIWQILNNIKFQNKEKLETISIQDCDEDMAIRRAMFNALTIKGKLSATEILNASLNEPKKWDLKNYKEVEGNETISRLYKAFEKMVELSGHEFSNGDKQTQIKEIFQSLGIETSVLEFDSSVPNKQMTQQPMYRLWHLLYSFEGDNSESGHDSLVKKLEDEFSIPNDLARPLVNVVFKDDYGQLSAKAISKILPYLQDGNIYSDACALAGYNHSHSQNKEDIENRVLEDTLRLLPKNSLRNPVVEKILNQMVNVVNAIITKYGKPDEVRIELARELKKSAKERADATSGIAKATREHEEIRKELAAMPPFSTGVRITKNDIIKYKLYKELASTGYKTIYTNTYIPKEKLFTKEFDIEHIIPKAVLFDDSFSNKTLSVRDFNRVKSDKTGIDAVTEKYGENSADLDRYTDTVNKLVKEGKISRTKGKKLLMKAGDIPDGFIDRDLRNSQYIAKKSQEMLSKVFRKVNSTTGSITDKLREDWQLVNVLKDLNWDKYHKLGLTAFETTKDGAQVRVIKDWTKRNDHRHHAMDAITVAFTKHSHVQYFNYLNARRDEGHKKHNTIKGLENSILEKVATKNGKTKTIIKPPIPLAEFRKQAKEHLEKTLISFKAKNKVVTRNINKTKKNGGFNQQSTLTPRGQLHKETVYGQKQYYQTKEEKVGGKFDKENIAKVANKRYRKALENRIAEFDNDPKKAFTGKNALSKNPIWLDEHQSAQVPEKVKLVWLANQYTIRKEIGPDLKIEKVIDVGAKRALRARLDEFDGKPKEAFANLEQNPIWIQKPIPKEKWENPLKPKVNEKGIQLKRVTITGVSNAEPLHTKKDHLGNEILGADGKPIPNDFVSTGNNHHVAIYRDKSGKLQEKVVSFYEAVMAKNAGLPVVDKSFNEHLGWEFQFTMKQNEYFVFPNAKTGFDPSKIDPFKEGNYHLISPNLFRVQKISTKNYMFTHHLETTATTGEDLKKRKSLIGTKYHFIQTPDNLEGITKVRINHLGQIVKVGE